MSKDAFGFKFWLGWILKFAGSFFLSALFWTFLMKALFQDFTAKELILTWSVAVFGSWFLLVTPFMRKKEQIWKRLNVDQEKAVDAWLGGMGILIGGLILILFGWSWVYRGEISSEWLGSDPNIGVRPHFFHPGWMKAVLGSWLILLLPVLVWMYRQADRIFKHAVQRQTERGPAFRTAFIQKEKRMLPPPISGKVGLWPETLENGHLVKLRLKDGREIPHVFVLNRREILGVYDRPSMDFETQDILDAEPQDPVPAYEESKWLRLDTAVGADPRVRP